MDNQEMNILLGFATQHIKSLVQFRRVSVVLGNETCDLDSAVSCLAYSFLLYHKKTAESIIIPVFNIPRNQFPVKTEVTFALSKYGINLDNIVFRDDIDLNEIQASGSLQLTLVDHHTLQPPDHQLVSSVVAVVDHRPHDPAWPWPNADVTLQVVGSCCTLVAEKLLAQAPDVVKPSVATLLLGTILLDTACLSPAVGRATALDHQMADLLQARCDGPVDRQQLCDELQAAKSDTSSLTTAQLLIKDVKVAAGIPIVGLPMKVKEFLQRHDASSSVQRFCEESGAQVCVVYGMQVVGGALTRDIAVYSRTNTEGASQVVAALQASQEPNLELQPQLNSVEGFVLFEQLNIKASRKQVLPIIRQVGEKLSGN